MDKHYSLIWFEAVLQDPTSVWFKESLFIIVMFQLCSDTEELSLELDYEFSKFPCEAPEKIQLSVNMEVSR